MEFIQILKLMFFFTLKLPNNPRVENKIPSHQNSYWLNIVL